MNEIQLEVSGCEYLDHQSRPMHFDEQADFANLDLSASRNDYSAKSLELAKINLNELKKDGRQQPGRG
ncbi:hypothetical protein OAA27_00130 [bacterium]|nr:hypothetical protein [bacterium]